MVWVHTSDVRRRAPVPIIAAAAGLACCTLAAADDEALAQVGGGFDAAELIPASASALPPILPGHEPGARERVPSAPADESDAPREWFGHSDWWTWSRLTGDWAGARTQLGAWGIEFDGSLLNEWQQVLSGGLAEKSTYRFLLDLNLTFDLGLLAGLDGATVFADFQTSDVTVGGGYDGAYQATSNIDIGGSFTQLSELWWEQWLFDRALRIKLGKVDANTEFAFIEAAGGFVNSSPGITPTAVGMPTYPDPATSINVFLYPCDEGYLGVGFYDGAAAVDGVRTGSRGPSSFFSDDRSDDYYFIAEAGMTVESLRAAVGGWWHTGDFPTFDGATESGTGGLYGLIEGRIWSPASGEAVSGASGAAESESDDSRGIWLYGQFGWADDEISDVATQYGAGIVFTGLVPGRDADGFGLAATLADFTKNPNAGFASDELVVELYYELALTPGLVVKPDLQWVRNPSGDSSADDVFVAGLRCTLSF